MMSISNIVRWTATTTLGVLSASLAQGEPPQTLDDELAGFVEQYIAGQGIEYHADVTAWINPAYMEGADEPVSGSFSGWALDQRYAQHMMLDPDAGFTIDKKIAFDGAESQSIENGVFAVKAGAVPDHGRVLPDPLGEAIQFLYSLSEEHPLDSARFTTPFTDPELQARMATAEWIAWDAESATAEFPGGTLHAEQYTHRVEFDRIEGVAVPRVVERRVDGSVRTRLSLEEMAAFPSPAGPQLWPTDITYQSFSPDGTLVAEFQYDMTTIDATGSFEDDVFMLSPEDADKVWDADLRDFIQN